MIRPSDILHSSSLLVQPCSYNKSHLHTAPDFISLHVLVLFFFSPPLLLLLSPSLSGREQFVILEHLVKMPWLGFPLCETERQHVRSGAEARLSSPSLPAGLTSPLSSLPANSWFWGEIWAWQRPIYCLAP